MKYQIKTILFASLIAAMVLPFSGMNYATAETAGKEIQIPESLDAKKYWIQEQVGDALYNMTETERSIFFAQLEESLKNRTLEEIEMDKQFEKMSRIILKEKRTGTYDVENPSDRALKQLAVINDLPIIKRSNELTALDDKIQVKIQQSQLDGEENIAFSMEELGVEFEEKESNPFRVGTLEGTTIPKSVELGHQNRISIPTANYLGHDINVWTIDSDITTEFPNYLMVDGDSKRVNTNGGTFKFRGYACLTDRGDMTNSVKFDMYGSRIITNAFGTPIYFNTQHVEDKKLYFNMEGYCIVIGSDKVYKSPVSVLGSHAYQTSAILDVTVR